MMINTIDTDEPSVELDTIILYYSKTSKLQHSIIDRTVRLLNGINAHPIERFRKEKITSLILQVCENFANGSGGGVKMSTKHSRKNKQA